MLNSTGRKQVQGFTIVELLIVIVVIGILAAIVIVAFNGVSNSAREGKIKAELRDAKQAIQRLEIDTNGTVFGCATRTFGPEGSLQAAGTGLVSAPTTAMPDNEGCTWSSGAVASWKGPYLPSYLDPWGRSYRIDLDYFICESGAARLIAAVVSMGENGALNYPSTTTSGACANSGSDDIYVELWRS